MPGLKQIALLRGAQDELDCDDFEVFAHGTKTSFADELVRTNGGCLSAVGGKHGGKFFTVPDLAVAMIFAKRTADNARERPKVVAFALPPALVKRFKNMGQLTCPPIDGPPPGVMPNTPQFVFDRGVLKELSDHGFFFIAS